MKKLKWVIVSLAVCVCCLVISDIRPEPAIEAKAETNTAPVAEVQSAAGVSLVNIETTALPMSAEETSEESGAEVAESQTAEAEPEEKKELLGTWTITEYCVRCNSGSAHQTASGKRAEEYYTAAVSRANYKQLKGCLIYVEGWGTFEIMDWGSVSGCDRDKWVDLFLPESECNRVYERAKVYLITKGD
ncbi:MAG: hypothetical protein IJU01_04560 [Lachnospiraceae bacterium]|nr:hypothetical protein [Lachnospiraceae bacterium]